VLLCNSCNISDKSRRSTTISVAVRALPIDLTSVIAVTGMMLWHHAAVELCLSMQSIALNTIACSSVHTKSLQPNITGVTMLD
jgi:predicted metal-binding protein